MSPFYALLSHEKKLYLKNLKTELCDPTMKCNEVKTEQNLYYRLSCMVPDNLRFYLLS